MDLVQGIIRAIKLDVSLYEEVERDPSTMQSAMTIVAISSLAAGIGSAGGGSGLVGMLLLLVFTTIMSFIAWYVNTFVIYILGTKVMAGPNTQSNHGELLRTVGFAQAPRILQIAGIVPIVGPLIALVASVWALVTTVVAVRQALDYDETWRAVVVCVIGWVISTILIIIPTVVIGVIMAMLGMSAG